MGFVEASVAVEAGGFVYQAVPPNGIHARRAFVGGGGNQGIFDIFVAEPVVATFDAGRQSGNIGGGVGRADIGGFLRVDAVGGEELGGGDAPVFGQLAAGVLGFLAACLVVGADGEKAFFQLGGDKGQGGAGVGDGAVFVAGGFEHEHVAVDEFAVQRQQIAVVEFFVVFAVFDADVVGGGVVAV